MERLTSKADGFSFNQTSLHPMPRFPQPPPNRYSLGKFHNNEVPAYYGPQ